MKKATALLLLLGVLGCDLGSPSSDSGEDTRTITYRITSDSQTTAQGVAWTENAHSAPSHEANPNYSLPWQITIPFYEGQKFVGGHTTSGDVTVEILVDGEVVTSNYFPPSPSSVLVGAVAASGYVVNIFTSATDWSDVDWEVEQSYRIMPLYGYDGGSPGVPVHFDTPYAMTELPGVVRLKKAAANSIVGLTTWHSGHMVHLLSIAGDMPYEVELHFPDVR